MTSSLMGYTTRANVEQFLGRTFSEVTTAEFNNYLTASEAYINNYLGYNGETTTSGILRESVIREKSTGKVDQFGNLVIDLMHPPLAFDVNGNPLVTLLEFNLGGIRVPLQLTDGSTNALNTLLEVSENRRKVYYPSLYFYPAISSVTPTAKTNLFNLRDVRFWTDISYIGGYAVIPGDITMAANELCGDMVLNRDNPSNSISYRQGQFQIEYLPRSGSYVKGQPASRAMESAMALLQPYVRYTW